MNAPNTTPDKKSKKTILRATPGRNDFFGCMYCAIDDEKLILSKNINTMKVPDGNESGKPVSWSLRRMIKINRLMY